MLRNIFAFGILVLLRQLLLKFAALCGQTGDNPSHYRNRRACTMRVMLHVHKMFAQCMHSNLMHRCQTSLLGPPHKYNTI